MTTRMTQSTAILIFLAAASTPGVALAQAKGTASTPVTGTSYHEMEESPQSLEQWRRELQAEFNIHDVNANGTIDLTEFHRYWQADAREFIVDLFQSTDKDGDGKITMPEAERSALDDDYIWEQLGNSEGASEAGVAAIRSESEGSQNFEEEIADLFESDSTPYEHLISMRADFHAADSNLDGTVTLPEFELALFSELEEWTVADFQQADANGDLKITLDEALAEMVRAYAQGL